MDEYQRGNMLGEKRRAAVFTQTVGKQIIHILQEELLNLKILKI